jgi:hypothetical protein
MDRRSPKALAHASQQTYQKEKCMHAVPEGIFKYA